MKDEILKGRGSEHWNEWGSMNISDRTHSEIVFLVSKAGNADTERFMRTMKEELLWLRDWKDLEEMERELIPWFKWYNAHYPHSSLNWRSPDEVHKLE